MTDVAVCVVCQCSSLPTWGRDQVSAGRVHQLSLWPCPPGVVRSQGRKSADHLHGTAGSQEAAGLGYPSLGRQGRGRGGRVGCSVWAPSACLWARGFVQQLSFQSRCLWVRSKTGHSHHPLYCPPWPFSAGSLPVLCSSGARAGPGGCQAAASIQLWPSLPSPALLHQVEREHGELN